MNDKFNIENEDNMEKEKKSKIKKILVNLTIFILLIILTFSLVLKDQDVSQIFSVAAKVKKTIYSICCTCNEHLHFRRSCKYYENFERTW